MRVRKTTHHLRFVDACGNARKALLAAAKLIETRARGDWSPMPDTAQAMYREAVAA